jgi:hypothetical protein
MFTTLEDLDFADDIALLSTKQDHMQEKTSRLSHFASQIGLELQILHCCYTALFLSSGCIVWTSKWVVIFGMQILLWLAYF